MQKFNNLYNYHKITTLCTFMFGFFKDNSFVNFSVKSKHDLKTVILRESTITIFDDH